MLCVKPLSNLAICELVGYESPEHFMRTLKKHME